eukprot:4910067-Amphidinium_carterae.2
MLEFIRWCGRDDYIAAIDKIERRGGGASTDQQHCFSLPSLQELSGLFSAWLSPGCETAQSTFQHPSCSSTFVNFIGATHAIAMSAAFNSTIGISPPLLRNESPCVQRQASCSSSVFSAALKLVTINVRSMNDSGKVKFVFKQLQKINADIAFIQETRLPEHFDYSMLDSFHLVAAPSIRGQGGLLIAVKQEQFVTPIQHKVVSPRVLVATFEIAGKRCKLVCMHAPTAETLQREHDTFAQDVKGALEMNDGSELTFIGTDLNARLNGLQSTFSCVSECAVSECPRHADFRAECLRALSSSCMVAANTILSEPTHTTWKHPSGTEQQIDFVFIPDQLVANGKLLSCSVGQWSKRASRTSSKRRTRAQFVNDTHIAAYCVAMKKELAPWDGIEPAPTYIEKALKLATSTVASTSSRRASQRKPWISEEAWERMYSMNMWRRYSVAFRRRDLLLAQSLWSRLGSPLIDGHTLHDRSTGSHQALAARIKFEHGLLRKQLRSCRRVWLHSKCEQVDAFDKSRHSRLLHQAIKAICVTKSYRGTRLLDDQGVIASDGEVVAGKWLRYWQEHFSASASEASDFSDRSKLTPSLGHVSQGEEGPFFVEEEVHRTLKNMPKWRATSDPVPAP